MSIGRQKVIPTKKIWLKLKKILIRRTWEKSDTYNLFLAVIKKMIRRTPRTACFYVMCAPTPHDTQRCKERDGSHPSLFPDLCLSINNCFI